MIYPTQKCLGCFFSFFPIPSSFSSSSLLWLLLPITHYFKLSSQSCLSISIKFSPHTRHVFMCIPLTDWPRFLSWGIISHSARNEKLWREAALADSHLQVPLHLALVTHGLLSSYKTPSTLHHPSDDCNWLIAIEQHCFPTRKICAIGQ